MSKLDKPIVSVMILLLLLATSARPQDQSAAYPKKDIPYSTHQLGSPIPPVPCLARADAVIADTGKVFSDEHSLVDSYNSTLGDYGGSNVGHHGNVQAAETIVLHGLIHGTKLEHTPAGLGDLPVPSNARPLPLGSHVPGSLHIHDHHDSITLRPGNYVASEIDLDFPGTINVFPAGLVSIFVAGKLSLGGHANLHGSPKNLQFIVLGSHEVHVQHHGTLVGLIYAPKADVHVDSDVFGSVVGRTVKLDEHSAVHYDQSSVCPAPPPTSPAIPPAALPSPPPAKVGCYVNTRNGWKDTSCATDAFIDAHFPHPDTQLTVASSATNPLVFGQLEVTIPEVTSENNAFLASTASISPLCQSTGSPVPNQWSVQSNTNTYAAPSGNPSAGDTAATQFVIQSNGTNNIICVWNVDISTTDYTHRTCVSPTPQQRSGGLQAFDSGNLAATMNSNGTMSLVAQLSWVPNGQPNQYAVTAPDTYGLASSWNEVSGGLIGMGACSQAQLTNAEVITQVLASTCPGDTQDDSPVCGPPVFQPDATAFIGSTGTVETNNLTATTSSPSVSFLNSDLVVSNVTATTSGGCLGPSHAYVKDSAEDFGATPSTIGDQVFWESPDIFLVPHGTPVDLNSVSSESIITPGGQFDIWVRLHNDLGCSDVTNAKTLVYLADPSALSTQWVTITGMNYVGPGGSSTGVTVPTGGEALIGPLPFTAPTTGLGNGHKCLLAAIQADGEAAPASSTDAPDSNQVAQRNIQFVGPCEYPITNSTTSNGNVQFALTVTPNSGTVPSLTALPNVQATFDDADSSWFNVWSAQPGSGSTFSVTHTGSSTTVRLGAFSVALNAVPLAAGQSRNLTSTIQPSSGTLTVQFAATLTGPGGQVLVTNGGSCSASVPVIQ